MPDTPKKDVARQPEEVKTDKVVSEQTAASAPTSAPAAETPAPKKKNPLLLILGIIVGLVALCCACGFGGYYALNYTIQNSPQAKAVKAVFTALNDNDQAAVRTLTTNELYNDLYQTAEGTSFATALKNNVDKVTIYTVTTETDTATVTYKLTLKNNSVAVMPFNYAELQKRGDAWIVSYLGTGSGDTTTPTVTGLD